MESRSRNSEVINEVLSEALLARYIDGKLSGKDYKFVENKIYTEVKSMDKYQEVLKKRDFLDDLIPKPRIGAKELKLLTNQCVDLIKFNKSKKVSVLSRIINFLNKQIL